MSSTSSTGSSAPSTGTNRPPPNAQTPASRKFPRTRTGCLTCRRRKKKCDEKKPHCVACTRNKLECEWPPHIIRIFGLNSDSKKDDLERRGSNGTESTTSSDGSIATSTSLVIRDSDPLQVIESHDENAVIERESAIAWSKGLNTFLSPRRAGMLLPASETLLSHYLEMTGPLLATAPSHGTPFVSWVMPVAYNDDLLMHSVLALSGAHLSFRAETPEIKRAVYQHYCLVVKTLRQISQSESLLKDQFVLLRVAMTLVMLCQYEVIAGNLDGSFFMHLRASRHIILELQNRRHEFKTEAERKLYGFVVEFYAYFVLCNNITPSGMNKRRNLIHDPFLQSLDDLQDFGALGVMFGGSHGLCGLISSISVFAAQQELLHSGQNVPDPKRLATCNKLKETTLNWNPSDTECVEAEWPSLRRATQEVYRNTLLMFLETALSPLSKRDTERLARIQCYVDLAIVDLPSILPSNYSCILMWPLIMIGSCAVKQEQRSLIQDILKHNQYMMRHCAQACELLEMLWADDDEFTIGPRGLGLLMERHNYNYGVI